MALPIEDYAMIGDCKTAALVGRDGSIDWLCWPRFDSAACFAALLGTSENGRWLIAPKCRPLDVRRRYRPGTLILETEFQTEDGSARAYPIELKQPTRPDLHNGGFHDP
jgi:GH15 family glucan-1,4-alpha-glucosidase